MGELMYKPMKPIEPKRIGRELESHPISAYSSVENVINEIKSKIPYGFPLSKVELSVKRDYGDSYSLVIEFYQETYMHDKEYNEAIAEYKAELVEYKDNMKKYIEHLSKETK